MDIRGKEVLVFGSGISGVAAGRLLLKKGAKVCIYDGNTALDKEKIFRELQSGGTGKAEIILGELPELLLKKIDLAVISPGVPTDLPLVKAIQERKIPLWGEIELAYVFGKGDVLAITGTNGKTTTTALLGEIVKENAESSFVVGNIGNPYTDIALETREDSVIVAEMSSFQLETIHTFRPKVSAILNITPDHLNRHHTMEAYIAAKQNIARNQMAEDFCVLNYEDHVTRSFGEKVKAQVLYFSSRRKLKRGVYLEKGEIILNLGQETPICHIDELHLLGTHNYENVMAATAMAAAYGIPAKKIQKAVKNFQGVAPVSYTHLFVSAMHLNRALPSNLLRWPQGWRQARLQVMRHIPAEVPCM